MRYTYVLFLGTLMAGAAAWAGETMRCGNVLIQPGESLGFVLDQCGPPQLRSTVTDPVWARGLLGTYVAGISGYEIWRYDRGAGQFPANLVFREGKLRRIEFESRPR